MTLTSVVSVTSGQPTGTMKDMEHVVIYMQENRPFDHYYGVLQGVRGFNDHSHPKLKSGKSVFH